MVDLKLIFCFFPFLLFTGKVTAQDNKTDFSYASRLIYQHPAVNWNEALPIGNGRLGAMCYNNVSEELISLNEQTLWSGGPRQWNNAGAKEYLPLVRTAALSGDFRKADSLSRFMQGPYTESYMPMADLKISYSGIKDSSHYQRELNLDSAISKLQFGSRGNIHRRTCFVSFPDQVMVLKQEAITSLLKFRVSISSKLRYSVKTVAKNHLVLTGHVPVHVEPAYLWKIKNDQAIRYGTEEQSMTFQVDIFVDVKGGTADSSGNELLINNAREAVLIISAATSYNGYQYAPGGRKKDPAAISANILKNAITKSYDQLLARHIADYQQVYRRLYLNLGHSVNSSLSLDERLKKMDSYTDPEIVSMIVQYGRYLLISSSRPGGQPSNLKGIWNDRIRPEYSSNWCLDHDAQMFYYAAETANTGEMHLPFLDFIQGLSENGKITAGENYGLRGWCAHHNTDLWRSTGASGNWGEGNPHWATWNLSGPWLSAHLYEHFQFSADTLFLRNTAWPIMKGAALFCKDWLITNDKGQFISVPSVSPENTFITAENDTAQISVSTTADIALMKDIFKNTIDVARILKTDSLFADSLLVILSKLPPYPIGPDGQLLEWQQNWRAVDPAHRHLSHMYPVFPGSEISMVKTPELAIAAKKALTLREKTNCSWGFAWKAACWARLGEGDSAWNTWKYQLRYVSPLSTSSKDNYGLFPNLFNSDGKDVIMNGNGCATAVMMEMIMQSHTGTIDLLPALPSIFKSGTITGMRARNGFEVSITWNNRKLIESVIESLSGNECVVRCGEKIEVYWGRKKINAIENEKNQYSFSTKKGEKYRLVTVR